MEGVDSLLGLSVVGHFNKAKSPRATGLAIHDNRGAHDFTVFGEELIQFVIGR
jgi:hypothetical protein